MTATAQRNPGDLAAMVSGFGLTMESVFVPFSQSRNKGDKLPSLNWRVTLKHNGRAIIETDYMAGCAHCPAYNASIKELGPRDSLMRTRAIAFECEQGRRHAMVGKRNIEPNVFDVIHSLLMDGDAIDYSSFEEWADNYGYGADSRKAEAIYRQCLEYGLKLRNALGDTALSTLREAFQDY